MCTVATKNVLIVVPENDVSALLALALAEEDYEVSVVESLPEAVDVLSSYSFDLIITEVFGQDSVYVFRSAFLDELKDAALQTPIILCSSCPSTHHLRTEHYGLAGVILRPFRLNDVVNKVNGVLQGVKQAPV